MYPSTRYELEILAHPKGDDLYGRRMPGSSYQVKILWDFRLWLDASADTPQALGRIVGESIQGIAEAFEARTANPPIRHTAGL